MVVLDLARMGRTAAKRLPAYATSSPRGAKLSRLVSRIRERRVALFGDVRYWIENKTYWPDEIAVRFHNRLVLTHPFPNGNGRHARLIADVLAMKLGRPAFTWGAADLVNQGKARARYLDAIRTADNGDIQPLIAFARS